MKTIVYVDGFNFYFGLLRHSPYKWLDLVSLFENELLPLQSPEAELIKVKLFTAPVLAKFATKKALAQQSQERYWRALETTYPDKIEIVKGYYSSSYQNALKYITPPDKAERVDTWKLEEKLTDVQMALHMYRDATQGLCEQIVIASNDSDVEPAAKFIKSDTKVTIGVVLPRTPVHDRTSSKHLRDIADWNINAVRPEWLKTHQFPNKIATNRKPILKPEYW